MLNTDSCETLSSMQKRHYNHSMIAFLMVSNSKIISSLCHFHVCVCTYVCVYINTHTYIYYIYTQRISESNLKVFCLCCSILGALAKKKKTQWNTAHRLQLNFLKFILSQVIMSGITTEPLQQPTRSLTVSTPSF